MSAVASALPPDSRIADRYAGSHLADAFSVSLPLDAATDPELLARHVFEQQPPWIGRLMALRDGLVRGFGIKTSKQLMNVRPDADRIGIFRIYERGANEIVLGEDDRHLDFRVSVLSRIEGAGDARAGRLVVTTAVQCHNLLGRTYLRLITPFHRLVVASLLNHAAQRGWPRTTVR
ncbi:MAG: DUF2867 domain-containing protein [Caldimonas sp.]